MCSLHFFSDMVLVLERLSTKIPKSFLTSIAFTNSHRTLIQNKSLTGLLCLSKLWLDNHCLREGFRKRLVTIYMWYTTLYTIFSTFCVYLSSLPKPLWLNLFLSLFPPFLSHDPSEWPGHGDILALLWLLLQQIHTKTQIGTPHKKTD